MPIGMGAGLAASGIGGFMGAKSAQPKAIPVPPPAPVFPWLNSQYTGEIGRAGTTGIGQLEQTAKTGNPIDIMPLYEAIVGAKQRSLGQGRANILESFGTSGNRYGTNARDAIVDYESQTTKDFTQTLADLIRQMGESASNRSVQSSSLLAQMFGSSAMTLAPTAVITSGAPSPTGSLLSSGGSGIEQIGLLQALGIF